MIPVVPAATKPSSESKQIFPVQLHHVLTELERSGLMHIASWQPHGRSFKIHKRAEFVAKILPTWFRQHKYASFQRQLNIYGFKQIPAGPDNESYYHEYFLRCQPMMLHLIQRVAIKGHGRRGPVNPLHVPNFYQMTPMPPSNPTVASSTAMATTAEAAPLAASNGSRHISHGSIGVDGRRLDHTLLPVVLPQHQEQNWSQSFGPSHGEMPHKLAPEAASHPAAATRGRSSASDTQPTPTAAAADTANGRNNWAHQAASGYAQRAINSNNPQPPVELTVLLLLQQQREQQEQAQRDEQHLRANELLLLLANRPEPRLQLQESEASGPEHRLQTRAPVAIPVPVTLQLQRAAQLDVLSQQFAAPQTRHHLRTLAPQSSTNVVTALSIRPSVSMPPTQPQVTIPLSEYIAYLELLQSRGNL